ncbi:MAG: hypothetical protein MJ065_03025 [Oscillospiraceae bacterium]|nr:hypothetical protein [Oscillospiraceae bacterium]
MAAQKPQQKGIFLRVREWLRRRHPRFRTRGQVVILPRRARCFGGRLTLSLPADFTVNRRQKDHVQLHGAVSGLELMLMQVPFRRRIGTVSALDLQLAFRKLGLPHSLPEMQHGFLRYSPMLTAQWNGKEKTVLHLIQVRQTVFLLCFMNVTEEAEPDVRAVIATAEIDKDQ